MWCISTYRSPSTTISNTSKLNEGLVSDLSAVPNPHHCSSNNEINENKKKLDDHTEITLRDERTAKEKDLEENDENIEIDRSPDSRFIKYKKEVYFYIKLNILTV